MRRRTGPVQQWVDSIPSPSKLNVLIEQQNVGSDSPTAPPTPVCPKKIPSLKENYPNNPDMTVSASITVPDSPAITMTGVSNSVLYNRLVRDSSIQSDSSHCSSVESLLELRKADPEAVLLGLGFGGCPNSPQENSPLSRIPRRFLQPSKLKGITVNEFLKRQQETSESFDSASLGYRGLTGSPYVAPSEIVQKIMERLREHESHEQDTHAIYNNHFDQFSSSQQDGRLSVLSPDNRQFLERPRSKSPDMRNKRMIIGQKSFVFGCDGDLIEINASDKQQSSPNLHSYSTDLDYSNTNVDTIDSELGPNLDKINNLTEASSRKFEKRLAKQLSFDDDTPSSSSELEDNVLTFDVQQCNEEKQECKTDHQRIQDLQRISEERVDSEDQGDSLVTVISRWTSNDTQFDKKYRPMDDDDKQKRVAGSRRASDSACDAKLTRTKLTRDEGRRFSDGVMHTTLRTNSNDAILSGRRKSLKRQARISDADAIEYCGLESFETASVKSEEKEKSDGSKVTSKQNKCISQEDEKIESNATMKLCELDRLDASKQLKTLNINEDVNSEASGIEFNERTELMGTQVSSESNICSHKLSHDTSTEKIMKIDDNLCCLEEGHRCCQSDELERVCEHDKNCKECCYHANSTNCWRKMQKIMQKNKKLEDMVVKSRQEMAEIRDMLSNVLSVRMEPGF